MKYNRQKEMLSYIRDRKSVKNEEILDRFNISIQTLRRDINSFARQGLIEKVYGGVIYNEQSASVTSTASLQDRESSNADEKEYLAKLAAELVEDGDVIFIDSGSTAYRILHYLEHVSNVTVISHCLDVLNVLRKMPNLTAICVGGVLQPDSGVFTVDSTFYPFNYSKAFIATVGISTVKSLTNTNMYEGAMKAHVIKQSTKVYIVADHSKFDVVAYNHFADFDKISAIVTDRRPSEHFEHFFDNLNIDLIY